MYPRPWSRFLHLAPPPPKQPDQAETEAEMIARENGEVFSLIRALFILQILYLTKYMTVICD
jgi:hypothetical protein